MNDWKKTQYSDTFKDLVDNSNKNVDNALFDEVMIGAILSNGVLYTGNETIDSKIIKPLENVLAGTIVNSDTILDNFLLFYRDSNTITKLDMFPIDLLSYADGKLHFFYIKADKSYRISDYMFGSADEILLFRFVINPNNTWNHIYFIAQRAGTPMYHAQEEWYEIEGMQVKSPKGLELSQSPGTVKRSGIDFTDKTSPDLYKFYYLADDKIKLRYVNEDNEVDYSKEPIYNVITDRYMEYNMNIKLKFQAEEYIQAIQNESYMSNEYFIEKANELQEALNVNTSKEEQQQIINMCLDKIDSIYEIVDKLYTLLGDPTLSTVRKNGIYNNKLAIEEFISLNLENRITITSQQVAAIKNLSAYIFSINTAIYSEPLDKLLDIMQDELDLIVYEKGKILPVDKDKFTIQRILWDVYEQTLIMQYGNKIFNTFEEAVDNSNLLDFPPPFGKQIYIPLSIMLIKSGITSINDEPEVLILDRRWVNVDEEQTGYKDLVARATAEKALDVANNLSNRIAEELQPLQTQVDNLESALAITDSNVNGNKSSISTLNSSLTALTTKVNTINTNLNKNIETTTLISGNICIMTFKFWCNNHDGEFTHGYGTYYMPSGYTPIGVIACNTKNAVNSIEWTGHEGYGNHIFGFPATIQRIPGSTTGFNFIAHIPGSQMLTVEAKVLGLKPDTFKDGGSNIIGQV